MQLVFRFFILVLPLFFSLSAHAVFSCSELTASYAQEFWQNAEYSGTGKQAIPLSIVNERSLKTRYPTDVEGRWNQGEQGFFTGRDQHEISFRHIPSPYERATVVLVPGMAESMTYYKELIFSLTEEGYSVYIYDPRGQGWSGNLSRNPQMVHVRQHADYQNDLQLFLETVVLPNSKGDVVTLGNSNGALTAIRLAQREPHLLPHLIAVAPALRIRPDNLPRKVVTSVLHLRAIANGYAGYALGVKDALKGQKKEKIPVVRYSLPLIEQRKDPLVFRSGPSNGWVIEVVNAGNTAIRQVEKFKSHSLFLIPDTDRLVVERSSRYFAAKATQASSYEVAGAGHFVLFERDSTRNIALTEIFRFLVNPKSLTGPVTGREVNELEASAAFYLARGEKAFARYAMDEAIRVHEAKRTRFAEWEDPEFRRQLSVRDKTLWTAVADMPADQIVLYKAITERRLEEIKGLYGSK